MAKRRRARQRIEAISKTGTVPEILYKYRAWNEHTKSMIKGQVLFARSAALNDPFEFRLAKSNDDNICSIGAL